MQSSNVFRAYAGKRLYCTSFICAFNLHTSRLTGLPGGTLHWGSNAYWDYSVLWMDKLSEIGGLMKTIAAILLLLPCCAFGPGALGQDNHSVHPAPTPENGKAVIYAVERASGVMRFGADGKWLGALKPGTYLFASIDPGQHHLCVTGHLPLWKARQSQGESSRAYSPGVSALRSLYLSRIAERQLASSATHGFSTPSPLPATRAELADAAPKWLINDGKFGYAQFDQIQHLNARVKLSLTLTLGKEKGATINFRALSHPRARRDDKKGCRLFVRVG
jgi:hypothetical protein